MARYFRELSFAERAAFDEAYKNASATLIRAISKLEIRKLSPESAREEADLNRQILDLQDRKALLKAGLAAFEAGDSMIEPPTPTQLATLQQQLSEVEQLVINSAILSGVLAATGSMLATYHEITLGGASS